MIYDYAVIGAGISGSVCAYQLSRFKKTCVIFEKNEKLIEKICGGGISYKALRRLEQIDIDTKPLFTYNSKSIGGHLIYNGADFLELKKYASSNRSLGIQRSIFDSYILNCAINEGAEIRYGHSVRNISYTDKMYIIDDCMVKNIVWAIGARSLQGTWIQGQSIGYTGQIYAELCFPSDVFYYWYYEKGNENKYFWAFPIGEKLWNVGVWSRRPFHNIKKEYNMCLNKYFLCKIKGNWEYYRLPRAKFLGHVDQRIKNSYLEYGVGDFAGKCNPLNGGGIINAIDSSIQFVNNVIDLK